MRCSLSRRIAESRFSVARSHWTFGHLPRSTRRTCFVNRIFGSAEWRQEYSEHWKFDRDKMRLFNDFERDVIKRFEQYQVPVIELKKETPKEAVCLIF